VAIAFALAASAAAPAQQPQPFRGGIDMVSLNVTVTDGTRYVSGLTRGDFEVFEDGVAQSISFFSREQQPIALAILLDTSNSMEDKLATAQEAAVGFVKRMRREDTIQVVEFNSRVQIAQPFTHDAAALERAIRGTSVNGSTSLYQAIYVSLKALKKERAQSPEDIRRQAIVVLSDGDDTSSLMTYEDVLEEALRSETAVYAIGVRQDSPRGKFREAEFVLRQLSEKTGGQAFFPTSVLELQKIYAQISDELSSQYTLAYSSKNPLRNGMWRKISVRVNRPGAVARTRQGYYAPSSPTVRHYAPSGGTGR
jgi:Ca-activated chloride channel family protein